VCENIRLAVTVNYSLSYIRDCIIQPIKKAYENTAHLDIVSLFIWFLLFVCLFVWWCLMPLSNNISAISWRSVLLVEETVGPGENHRPVASHWQTLSH